MVITANHPVQKTKKRKEKKRKEKKRKDNTMPFGINSTRSQVLYRTAQVLMLHMMLHMLLQTPEPHSFVMAVMQSRCMQSRCTSLCLSAIIREACRTSLLHMCSIAAFSNLAGHKTAACTTPSGSELHTCKNLLPDSTHAIKPTRLS